MAGAARTVGSSYVALLRGINVGGKNKLPMQDLAGLFREAGCTAVRTYIQSGNVLFSSATDPAKKIVPLIEKRITDRFGMRVPLVLRTEEELERVTRGNPFLKGEDTAALHVAFLAAEPTPAQVATLDPGRSPPDAFAVLGREIYLHCPNGIARTKLTNSWFDSRLGTTSTLRNWRTVLTLLELLKTAT